MRVGLKKWIAMLVIFVMVFAYLGETLEAVATTGDFSSLFSSSKNVVFGGYFEKNGSGEKENECSVLKKAVLTLDISPENIGEGFIKTGTIQAVATDENELNFKFSKITDIKVLENGEDYPVSENSEENTENNSDEKEETESGNSDETEGNEEESLENSSEETLKENSEDIPEEDKNSEGKTENSEEDTQNNSDEQKETAINTYEQMVDEDAIVQGIIEEEQAEEDNDLSIYQIDITDDNEITVNNVVYRTIIKVEIEYSKEKIDTSNLFQEVQLNFSGNYIDLKLKEKEENVSDIIVVKWKYENTQSEIFSEKQGIEIKSEEKTENSETEPEDEENNGEGNGNDENTVDEESGNEENENPGTEPEEENGNEGETVEEGEENSGEESGNESEDEEEKEPENNGTVSYNMSTDNTPISKAKINANYNQEEPKYETEFTEAVTLDIVTAGSVYEEINLNVTKETYLDAIGTNFETSDIYYSKATFDKEDMENILNNGGSIEIYNENRELITTIETAENAEVELSSISPKGIYIVFRNVNVNVNTTIVFSKVIGKSEYDKATFNTFRKLQSNISANVKVLGVEDIYEMPEISVQKELESSVTNASFSLANNNFNTLTSNENVEMKIVLNNDSGTSDLYVNPSFEFVFPEYIKNVTIQDLNITYAEGLQVGNFDAYNDNGIMKMKIDLIGTQEIFSSSALTHGTNILINCNIEVDKYAPNKKDEIRMYYCNEGVTNYSSQTNWNLSKEVPQGILRETNGFDVEIINYIAPNGFITANSITNYDGNGGIVSSIKQGEKTAQINPESVSQVATMELYVANNSANNCENVVLLGRIPFKNNKDIINGEDLGTTIDCHMSSAIQQINGTACEIYYSVNETATDDLNDSNNAWSLDTNNIEDVKSYMIVVLDEVKPGETLNFSYEFEIPANVGNDAFAFGSFGAYYNNSDTRKSKENVIADKVGLTTEVLVDETEENEENENSEYIENEDEEEYIELPKTEIEDEEDEEDEDESGYIGYEDEEVEGQEENENENENESKEEETENSETESESEGNGIRLEVNQRTNIQKSTICEGDKIDIMLDIKNMGKTDVEELEVSTNLSEYLEPEMISVKNDGSVSMNSYMYNDVKKTIWYIMSKSTCTVTITAKVKEGAIGQTIQNKWKVTKENMEDIESNEMIINVVESKEESADNSNANANNDNAVTGAYSISGTAWVDTNKNNIKDEDDLYNSNAKVQLMKDGNIVREVNTDNLGQYIFDGLEEGKYSLIFNYDKYKYSAVSYKINTAEENTNSSAYETSEGTAITDNIEITNTNIQNIDIGLIEKDRFDFEITESITKAIVSVNGEEKEYKYDYLDLAKLEINSKDLENAVVKIEYNLRVENVGNIDGKVSSIVNYLPTGMTFIEEDNPFWTLGTDGNVYYSGLKDTVITAGDFQNVKIILQKQMTTDNTGILSNKVKINYAESDTRITENKTNNFASQETIITEAESATGKVILGIIIVTLLIAGFGYMIKMGYLENIKIGKKIYK